jgi:hypothetical protein
MRNIVLLSSLKYGALSPHLRMQRAFVLQATAPVCSTRCGGPVWSTCLGMPQLGTVPVWGGTWGGVPCMACASRGASSQASIVRSPASVPRSRKRLRAEHAAITPAVGTGPAPRGPYHWPVWAPRRHCCRICDGCGSPCLPCVGGVPCLSSAWSPPPAHATPEAGPSAGGTRSDGALYARRPCRAAAACCWDSTPG